MFSFAKMHSLYFIWLLFNVQANAPYFLVRILGDSSCRGSKIMRSCDDRIYKNELFSEK